MFRALHLAAFILVFSAVCSAQDSGPGPVAPATSQEYDVTLYRRAATLDGTFVFTTTSTGTGPSTSGDLTATINAEEFTGTWRAHDLGNYAFWVATAEGTSNNLFAYGWATPDLVIGWSSLTSSGGSFFSRFFGKWYFFFGEAAATTTGM